MWFGDGERGERGEGERGGGEGEGGGGLAAPKKTGIYHQ